MAIQLTTEDARHSMQGHLAAKGAEILAKFGPLMGWNEMLRMLQDRTCVRYPCEVTFGGGELLEGELGHPFPVGERPEDGFRMVIHPYFASQPNRVPHIVLYQLVLVNYGEFASAEDAEIFGAAALGIGREDYYQTLCEMADEVG